MSILIVIAIIVSGISPFIISGLGGKTEDLSGEVKDLSDMIGDLTSAESELTSAVIDIGKAIGEYGEKIKSIEKRLTEMEKSTEEMEDLLKTPTPVFEQVLKWGTMIDPTTIDQARGASDTEQGVIWFNKDRLVDMSWRDGTIVYEPKLAETWEQFNETAWIFHIRKGVKFQKSSVELTAQHIAAATDRDLRIGRHSWAWDWYAGYEVIDKYTILYNSKVPLYIPRYIVFPPQSVEDIPALENRGGDIDAAVSEPSGTGPFIFKSWIKSERIEYEKNPNYWNGEPQIDRIVIKPIPDPESRVAALETGVVNLIDGVPPVYAAKLQDKGFKLEQRPGTRLVYLYINVHKAPFDDVKVRQAANYAINKEAITKNIFYGYYEPADSIAPSYSPQYVESPYKYNPEKARELLAESDYDGEEIVFWSMFGRLVNDREVTEAVAAYLRDVGFKVEVDIPNKSFHFPRMNVASTHVYETGLPPEDVEYHLCLNSQSERAGDIDSILYSQFKGGSWENRAFYDNAKVNELSILGRKTIDPDQRNEIFIEAQSILNEDAPAILLYHITNIWAMDPSVNDINLLPFDYLYLDEAYIESP